MIKKPRNDYPKKNAVKGGVYVYKNTDLTLGQFAKEIGISSGDILKYFFLNKIMLTINSIISDDMIGNACINFGFDFKKENIVKRENFEDIIIEDDPSKLEERSPVVTIMGHVDHGKTTLIDTIRDSHIALKEAGSITQEIGAYQKEIMGKKITFLDTPGHEAFTAMRARGAKVTDIVIIVVAADDGIMPQTLEAIDHALAAGVQIIVAINKIDKPGSNIEKVKQELSNHNLVPEEWGGTTIVKEISAKKNIGIEELLENVLVVAELMELKANKSRLAIGSVIESSLDKTEGPKATLLVQNGTLRVGDFLVVGDVYCKVRKMTNEHKKTLKTAGPSMPVMVTGLSEVPNAGDRFMVFETEKEAKDIAEKRRITRQLKSQTANSSTSAIDFLNKLSDQNLQKINVIIRADTDGSAEAVKSSLLKLKVEGVEINVLRATSGAITESDIILASASDAIVYGFSVRPSAVVRDKAKEEGVIIRLHSIIYAVTEEIEKAMKGLLKPETEEVVYGQAEVRQLFVASKIGTIAGSYVSSGVIKRDSKVRVIRNGVVVYEGELGSLKKGKDDAREVARTYECGITVNGFNDLKVDDIIESYGIEEVKNG